MPGTRTCHLFVANLYAHLGFVSFCPIAWPAKILHNRRATKVGLYLAGSSRSPQDALESVTVRALLAYYSLECFARTATLVADYDILTSPELHQFACEPIISKQVLTLPYIRGNFTPPNSCCIHARRTPSTARAADFSQKLAYALIVVDPLNDRAPLMSYYTASSGAVILPFSFLQSSVCAW